MLSSSSESDKIRRFHTFVFFGSSVFTVTGAGAGTSLGNPRIPRLSNYQMLRKYGLRI